MPNKVNILQYYIISYNIIIKSRRPNKIFIFKGSTYYINFNLINLETNIIKKLSTNYTLYRSRSKIFFFYSGFPNRYIVLKYCLRLQRS